MTVTYARGFRAAGTSAGFKESGRPDLALLVADVLCTAAGAFTTNAFAAAPVTLTQSNLVGAQAQAVVVNSGQANAGTGDAGLEDASAMAAAAAESLGLSDDDVLVCSTGVIGPRVPLDRYRAALPGLVAQLSYDGGSDFAEAICTTDTKIKTATADAGPFRVGGCAKGIGMVAPNLATMLSFVTTDAPVPPLLMRHLITERVRPVWNSLTIDQCRSTNDTVLVLASGAVDQRVDEDALGDAVETVCVDLAKQVAADGEGGTKTIVVQVDGAADADDARRVGLEIAGSPLVKTAVFGGDPNPGRILQAIGSSGAAFEPGQVRASLGGFTVIDGGVVLDARESAKPAMEGPEVVIAVVLGAGEASATVFGCDMSYDYVRINAEYTT
jgi:glutamate N-acetyltransferase / amino-acid N-acetyltransferase